jgi:hypothetical protein
MIISQSRPTATPLSASVSRQNDRSAGRQISKYMPPYHTGLRGVPVSPGPRTGDLPDPVPVSGIGTGRDRDSQEGQVLYVFVDVLID